MSRWFRHYAGMMRDDKLVRVAIRSKQPIERVAWVWGAILESAAEIDDAGRYDLDAAEVAYFLRTDEADIVRIVGELEVAGRIAESRVVKWGNRQFQSDRSAERVARHRANKRQGNVGNDLGNGGVTLQERYRIAPETETETELESEEETPQPPEGGRRGKSLIPENWEVPSVSDLPPKARACAEQWKPECYATHAEAFVLYWRSERKMKADWRGTWANRVIALHSQVMRDQKFGNAPPAVKATSKPQTAEECERQAKWYEDHGMADNAAEWRRKAKAVPVGQVVIPFLDIAKRSAAGTN